MERGSQEGERVRCGTENKGRGMRHSMRVVQMKVCCLEECERGALSAGFLLVIGRAPATPCC